jgi:iron complex transport system permease protein
MAYIKQDEKTGPGLSAVSAIGLGFLVSLAVLCCGISLGSSPISFAATLKVILYKLLPFIPIAPPDPQSAAIVWQLRLPRCLLAFMAGGALAVSGAVFQSVLKNQLASPYILGISSGASLGAGIVMLTGFSLPFIRGFTLPLAGFFSALTAIFLVIVLSSRLDRNLSNNTIILFGMVFSLFINAILILLCALYREELKNLLFWQLGSFANKGWAYTGFMVPFLVLGILGIVMFTGEMDILSFGEAEALSLGVNSGRVKKRLLAASAVLTGAAVALSGAVGFIDLIAPHVSRKLVGSRHRYVIPMAFLSGGSLLTITDLAARTVVSPSELPVGAVTALIGAPFFAWVYFGGRRRR